MRKHLRICALVLALLMILVTVIDIVAPYSAMELRGPDSTMPDHFYSGNALRILIASVLIQTESSARWPRILRALAYVLVVESAAAFLLGSERSRAIMEWQAMQGTALLRAESVLALASWVFVVLALSMGPVKEQRKIAH